MKRGSEKQGSRKAPKPAEPKPTEFIPYTRQLSKGELEELMKVGLVAKNIKVNDSGLWRSVERTCNSLKIGWRAWIVGFPREFERVKFIWGDTRIKKVYTPTAEAPHFTESLRGAGVSPMPANYQEFDLADRSCGFGLYENSPVYPERFIDEFESAEFDPLEKITIPQITAENYSKYVYLNVWHGNVLTATYNGTDHVILENYYYALRCGELSQIEWTNGICTAIIGKNNWCRAGDTLIEEINGKKVYHRPNRVSTNVYTTLAHEAGATASMSVASGVYHSPMIGELGHTWPVFANGRSGWQFYGHGVLVDCGEWINFNRVYTLMPALSMLPSTLSWEIMKYI
jgi:hypothetical protein